MGTAGSLIMSDKTKTEVLVVEDEPLIMMDAMQSLEDAGFDVVDAFDAEHALLCLEQRSDISALFTDVNMPGRSDGVQLARMVSERRRDVVVIVTSGGIKIQKSDLPEGGQFVPKPYRGENVAKLIEELVGAAGGISST